jgi:hypothetical protein
VFDANDNFPICLACAASNPFELFICCRGALNRILDAEEAPHA